MLLEDCDVVARNPRVILRTGHENVYIFEGIFSRKLRENPHGVICGTDTSYRLGGQKLVFNAKTEKIVGNEEAMKFYKREYRKPYVVEDSV